MSPELRERPTYAAILLAGLIAVVALGSAGLPVGIGLIALGAGAAALLERRRGWRQRAHRHPPLPAPGTRVRPSVLVPGERRRGSPLHFPGRRRPRSRA
ncbi:MAG TPA: hypothetical protein VGG40_04595 [Solirubrobacterales bacterium]|jgi:hypothetical protein